MQPIRNRFQSIEEVGLKNYLDGTKHEHNDVGYQTLKAMVDNETSIASVAKTFGVQWRTARHWIDLYKKEVANAR